MVNRGFSVSHVFVLSWLIILGQSLNFSLVGHCLPKVVSFLLYTFLTEP